ncbi:MAG TPA: hypothetical protein VNT54_07085 [Solirubrobacteraceae bacterium]|nr:hypothetical protein [Solirubrobacteraceae bacterium]
MPCQCGTTAVSEGTETAYGGCDCGSGSGAGCDCGSGVPTPSDVASNLERFVMELDKRVRKLEASR